MLRIGVMLDSMQVSAWMAYVLDEVQRSGFARVELVVLDTPMQAQRRTLGNRLLEVWRFAAFRRYERWDYQRNRGLHDAQALRDLQPLLGGVPVHAISSARTDLSESFSDAELAAIGAAELDVMLHFGSRRLRGEILQAARCGVWSLHHGNSRTYRGEPSLFWEIYEGHPASGTALQVLTSDREGGRGLYQSHAATNLRSLHGNRNPILWKSAELILRRLRALHEEGWAYLEALDTYREGRSEDASGESRSGDKSGEGRSGSESGLGRFGGAKTERTPHAGRMAVFFARSIGRMLGASVRSRLRGGYTQWFLAMRERTGEAAFSSASGYRVLPTPDDRFYADPMLLEHKGKTFLFFEDYRYVDERGLISCCELGGDGTPGEVFEVLRRPYHLSYPFVFEHGGAVYLIPESRQSGAVELYRAHDFPRDWRLERKLLEDVAAVDATLHFDGRRWWMFVGMSTGRYSTCDELALFFADSLDGAWTSHPRSPVVSDVRRARPAGRLFHEGGKLIRPSQDCAKAYGYGLVFSEIVTLTETEYEERVVGRIDPDWLAGNQGTHTYTRSSRFEVVDGNLPKRYPRAAIEANKHAQQGQATEDQGTGTAG